MRVGKSSANSVNLAEVRQKIPTVNILKIKPNTGDIVYNIEDRKLYYGDNSSWIQIDPGQPVQTTLPLTANDVQNRIKNGMAAQRYDSIIVGAGTSGAALAYNWARKYPTRRLLVLEAGRDDAKVSESNSPADPWGQLLRYNIFGGLGEGCAQWQTEIKTEDSQQLFETPIQHSRGSTWGGTSAVNICVWNRATKDTYDSWVNLTGDQNFNFDAMSQSYIKLENRSRRTRIYGQPVNYFTPGNQVPGFDLSSNMGSTGQINITQGFYPQAQVPVTPGNPYGFNTGYNSRAVQVSLAEAPLPGRTSTIPLFANAENPNNPQEVSFWTPQTFYDQSDPSFPTYNPYDDSFPGYTYTAPVGGSFRGPGFTGVPTYITGGAPTPKGLLARCYGAPAFIYPITRNFIPSNVTVVSNAYVTRLLFDPVNTNECIGAEYVVNGFQVAEVNRAIPRNEPYFTGTLSAVDRSPCSAAASKTNQQNVVTSQAYASFDIWLCAGVMDSPALLQRSGIGPRDVLENLTDNPPAVRVDLPGVGQSVQDTLDFAILYDTERNHSTNLPASSGAPNAAGELTFANYLGYTDPNPALPFVNPALTSTINGAPLDFFYSLRVKSSPDKSFSDAVILAGGSGGPQGLGSYLWQDIQNIVTSTELKNIDNSAIKPVFDRYKWGMGNGLNDNNYTTSAVWIAEYFDMRSQGKINIQSGNVFQKPVYSPNMGSNELDLEAMSNLFENTILPLSKRMAFKRYGVRGVATFVGTAVAATPITISLSIFLTRLKPFSNVIDQATYALPGSLNGYTIAISSGPGTGEVNVITSWGGGPGAFTATVLNPWTVTPDNTSTYSLNIPNSTPLDSVEFSYPNYRNFSKFQAPNGDVLFTPWKLQIVNNPFTTQAYQGPDFNNAFPINPGTEILINAPAHNIVTGEIIQISRVIVNVDNITPENFNGYHIVEVVDPNTLKIILEWNPTPLANSLGSPLNPPVISPGTGATGQTGVGGLGVLISYVNFDKAKFRTWLKTHYFSGWHGCCSCRMGKPTDGLAVLDTRCRVYNTKGIRVLDASSFPSKPNGNTQATVYGLSQKIFDLVSVEEYDPIFESLGL